MAYSELIKSFGKIREYMQESYIFGTKCRDNFRTKNCKSVSIAMDSRQSSHNPLYKGQKLEFMIITFCLKP